MIWIGGTQIRRQHEIKARTIGNSPTKRIFQHGRGLVIRSNPQYMAYLKFSGKNYRFQLLSTLFRIRP